jgi:hypothetical protein
VQAVGDECGRTDLAADLDAIARDDLVADEAEQPCDRDRPQVMDVLRVG